jgi:hypothetical protein
MLVAVVPSDSYNSKVFVAGFLTVNILDVVIEVELLSALIALNLICCPSLKV